MMQGLGFYIWQLKQNPIDQVLAALEYTGAKWVCIKVADGVRKWNQVNASGSVINNDSYLLQYIQRLQSAGYQVGGWHFIYPLPTLSPGAQAGLAGERYQKLKLDFFWIDAEQWTEGGAYWVALQSGLANPDARRSAVTYIEQVRGAGVPLSAPLGLSSYRFPKYFPSFPFKQFVNGPGSDHIPMQMYWEGAHNPAAQLALSITEYNTIVRNGLNPLPFVPIGAAYRNTAGWEPTAEDLQEFITACKQSGCPAWGFWELGYILANGRSDWLDAIAGKTVSEPPDEPPDEPPTFRGYPVEVTANVGLNLRQEPLASSLDLGTLAKGSDVTIDGESGEWLHVKDGWIHRAWVKKI